MKPETKTTVLGLLRLLRDDPGTLQAVRAAAARRAPPASHAYMDLRSGTGEAELDALIADVEAQ